MDPWKPISLGVGSSRMNQTQKLSFRTAEVKDQALLVEFQIAMALETEELTLDQATCQRGVGAVFTNSNLGTYYVAEKSGTVIGSLLIIPEWSDWRNGVVWWIHSVYVVPNERQSGVFSSFYQFLKQQCERREDLRGLRLYVDKRNIRAQAVYRKLGMSNEHYDLYEWLKPAFE